MIRHLFMNLMLTFIWVALTGSFMFINFVFGFTLSFFILWIMARRTDNKKYFNRIPKVIGFILYFLKELLKANLEVAYDLITPRYFMKPGIVKYPLAAKTDLEITLLANVISLTPGTLILDVSDDKKVIYIHVMYLKDRNEFVRLIQQGFEKKLLDILR